MMKTGIACTLVALFLLSSIAPALAATSNFEVVPGSEVVYPEEKLTIGTTVSSELTLEEISRSLTGKTRLQLTTELDDPVWTVIVDGEVPETYTVKSFDFVFDHESYDKVTIQLRGVAPSFGVETSIIIMDIKQVVAPEITNVYTIKRDVTSAGISDALNAIHRAQDKIIKAENATIDASDAGADVTEAEAYLQTARGFYNTSDALYRSGQMNESIAAANNACDNAQKAYDSAVQAYSSMESASRSQALRNKVVIIAVVIAILIIAVIAYNKRRWGKL